MEHHTFLNMFKLSIPSNWSIGLQLLRNNTSTSLFTIQDNLTKALFLFGCASVAGLSYYILQKPLSAFYTWYKSLGNAKERLEILTDKRRKNQKVYAVVYGANNNGSKAFCKHLAQNGYSLILIDRDESLLNSAEKHISADFPDISLIKIRMEEFDEAEALRVVKQVNKLGDVIRGIVFTKNIMLSEQNNKKFEQLTYEEVHQILHSNSEMIVGLTNVLLAAIKRNDNPFIINVKNIKYRWIADMVYWDLLYYSTSAFSSNFVCAVQKAEPSLYAINVEVDYSHIKEDSDKEKLCNKAFRYLGIWDTVKY